MDADVIVIGAGLSGLQAARRAQAANLRVVVLEADDAVGGRVRTDSIDGFLCDRGFQLLNPAYPAVREWVDVAALGLQRLGVGVVVRAGDETTTLAHPLRHPRYAFETLVSAHTPVSDLVALARWLIPPLLRPSSVYRAGSDEPLRTSFDHIGLRGRLRRDVLDTFLAGVLADSSGESSAQLVRLLMRFFAIGVPGLPRSGMQALPEQLAAALADPVRVGVAARDVRETSAGVDVVTDSGTVRARAAIVAVGPQDVAGLTDLPEPADRGLTTWWFTAPERPRDGPFLMLDASRPGGGPAGPIWHTAVISEAAPSYAPAGRHLVEATTLMDRPDGLATESDVRRDLERLYQTSVQSWEVLAHHVVPHALPAQLPPLTDLRPVWAGERTVITGDHRASGSIQGALDSGDRAGRMIGARLSG